MVLRRWLLLVVLAVCWGQPAVVLLGAQAQEEAAGTGASWSMPQGAVPAVAAAGECPRMLQPRDVGFLVINLDRSPGRLQRMREQFAALGLPPFERVPGVEVTAQRLAAGQAYDVPRLHAGLKPADYGTCLAHLRAWKHAYNGSRRWYIVLEDDAELVKGINFTGSYPLVPDDADLVFLRPGTLVEISEQPVCHNTTVRRTTWGYGMVGYLINRKGAGRLIKGAAGGFAGPMDGHIWKHKLYTMDRDWVTHYECEAPCTRSIRTYLNGELEGQAQPD